LRQAGVGDHGATWRDGACAACLGPRRADTRGGTASAVAAMSRTVDVNHVERVVPRADPALWPRRRLCGGKREQQRHGEQREAVEGAAFCPDGSTTYPGSTVG
jgi:hypothetical protein